MAAPAPNTSYATQNWLDKQILGFRTKSLHFSYRRGNASSLEKSLIKGHLIFDGMFLFGPKRRPPCYCFMVQHCRCTGVELKNDAPLSAPLRSRGDLELPANQWSGALRSFFLLSPAVSCWGCF